MWGGVPACVKMQTRSKSLYIVSAWKFNNSDQVRACEKGKRELQNAPGIILLRSDGKMPSISRTMATLNIYIIWARYYGSEGRLLGGLYELTRGAR